MCQRHYPPVPLSEELEEITAPGCLRGSDSVRVPVGCGPGEFTGSQKAGIMVFLYLNTFEKLSERKEDIKLKC